MPELHNCGKFHTYLLHAPKVRYGTMARVVLDGTLSEDRDNSEGEQRFYCSFKKCNECIFL